MGSEWVIVGGGIYGCGTAWELARSGADVTLLEAGEIASGASGGLGKRGVRANGRDPRELPLMEIAYDLWPDLASEIDAETGYERTGHLLLYEQEYGGLHGGFASATAREWLQSSKGVPTELLDAEEVQEMEPHVSDAVVGALYCPKDGVADHTATTEGLAAAAKREGADVHEHAPVVDMEREGSEVVAVRTEDGERIAVNGGLLLLSNVHAARFVEDQLGYPVPAWRILPQVMTTKPLETVPTKHLIGHDSRTLAIKELDDDRVMISGGWRGRWNEETGRGETISNQVEGNFAEATATYPMLEEVEIETTDASRTEITSVDHIPIIDRFDGADNMIVATGWSGHGFAISLAVNHLLAEWAIEGERPDLLAPFGYDRFL